jgi:hypothetical protein
MGSEAVCGGRFLAIATTGRRLAEPPAFLAVEQPEAGRSKPID